MNSSESSQPLRDPWQITSVMLNRFLSLSKNPFTPPQPIPFPLPILPILNGQYQAAWNANHRFWEDTSVKSYKIQLPVFLFFVLHQFLYQQILFLQFHSALSERNFCPKFSFFDEFTTLPPQPHHLNGQNLLNVTRFFVDLPENVFWNIFFPKIYWQNPEKHFLKVPTTDSLVICSKHSSTTAILTQASVITCK